MVHILQTPPWYKSLMYGPGVLHEVGEGGTENHSRQTAVTFRDKILQLEPSAATRVHNRMSHTFSLRMFQTNWENIGCLITYTLPPAAPSSAQQPPRHTNLRPLTEKKKKSKSNWPRISSRSNEMMDEKFNRCIRFIHPNVIEQRSKALKIYCKHSYLADGMPAEVP